MAVRDFTGSPTQARTDYNASRIFSTAMGRLGDSVNNLQRRELNRNLDNRQERQTSLNEEKQQADLAEAARKRKVAEDVRRGILNVDNDQRLGFDDQATIALNDKYKQLDAGRDALLGELSPDQKQEVLDPATGKVVPSKSVQKINQEYDKRRDALNQAAVSMYGSTGRDVKSYANDVYRSILENQGTVADAQTARDNAMKEADLTGIDKERLNLSGDIFNKNSSFVNSSVSGIPGSKTTKGKSDNYTARTTPDNVKNTELTRMVKDLKEQYPDDLFTIFGTDASGIANSISKRLREPAFTLQGKQYYPTAEQVYQAAIGSGDEGSPITEPALQEEQFKKNLKQIMLASLAQGGSSNNTYIQNRRNILSQADKMRQRNEQDYLNRANSILGNRQQISADDVNKRTKSIFMPETQASKDAKAKAAKAAKDKADKAKREAKAKAKRDADKKTIISEANALTDIRGFDTKKEDLMSSLKSDIEKLKKNKSKLTKKQSDRLELFTNYIEQLNAKDFELVRSLPAKEQERINSYNKKLLLGRTLDQILSGNNPFTTKTKKMRK